MRIFIICTFGAEMFQSNSIISPSSRPCRVLTPSSSCPRPQSLKFEDRPVLRTPDRRCMKELNRRRYIGDIWWRSQCHQLHCGHGFWDFFSVFFLTKNEDEDYPYSRSESIGMACLNKFAIDEENQNEITGVYFIKPWLQNSAFDKEVIQGALQQCPRAGISELIRPTVLLSVDPRQKA